MTLQPSTANFSLINYSQEKDLNNLVAARKHQKNPEKTIFISSPLWQNLIDTEKKVRKTYQSDEIRD